MSIDVTDLTTLDPVVVKAREQLLIQMLSEAFPTMDFTQGGILQQILTHPNTVLDVKNQQEIANVVASMSLKTIEANPSLADPTIVDALLSNYFITRTAATSAQGIMAVVIDQLTSVTVTTDTQFTANGRTFVPDKTYTAVTVSALLVNDTDRLIQQTADGNYWFTVNVIETVTGGAAVVSGVEFETDPEPTGFVRAYAAADFTAGAVAESNAAMVDKLADGISAKAVADRQSISALLHSEFPSLVDLSIIGAGDTEMTRDRANIMGMGVGGKADVYIRMSASPALTKLTIAAAPMAARLFPASVNMQSPDGGMPLTVHIGDTAIQGIFELNIGPTFVPGFYRIERITPADPTGTTTIDFTAYEPADRGIYTPSGAVYVPSISEATEARYSMYQGNAYARVESDAYTQIQHLSLLQTTLANTSELACYVNGTLYTLPTELDGTGTSVNSIYNLVTMYGYRIYDVYVSNVPNLAAVQDFFNQRSHQAPVADYLVRGAIPCYVGVTLTVGYKAGTEAPSISVLQAAVADAVNAVTFEAADLQAAVIVEAISTAMAGNGYALLPLAMTGDIAMPDGTTTALASESSLVIPSVPAQNVSRRTVAYYATPDDIDITLQAVTSWSV